MKKVLFGIIVFVFTFFISINNVSAREINFYFFHGDGCPHCAQEEEYLETIKDNKNVNIIEYEVWYSEENSEFMEKVLKELDEDTTGVPVSIIGDTVIFGYDESLDKKFNRAIEYYINDDHEYYDTVNEIKEGTYNKDEHEENGFLKSEEKLEENTSINVPAVGNVKLQEISLVSAAVLVGLVDGFNPCAMWVLLFLITLLLGMKDRKKMWAIGLTFLITSALVYFLIMMSWLTVVAKITTIVWVRNLIALFAIIAGIINLVNFKKSNDSGCTVVDDNKRKKIFGRIKKFTKEKNIFLAMGGACLLAISVNVVELACSAGLPLVFTQLLAINNVTGIQSILYTLLYVLFFMLDDLLVFGIAMYTTKITSFSTKFNKYSHLIGGIIMILIGLLLLFKPGWLMFNFK